MKRIKLVVILSVFAFVGIFTLSSRQFSSEAKGDSVLEEIGKYKSWAKVHKTDEKIANETFRVTDSSVAG